MNPLAELLGRYSNWTSWANRTRSIERTGANRPETSPRTRGTARRLSDDEVTELVARYHAGATIYDLAERFKIHRTTVSQHLHRRGVTMRGLSLDESQVDHATWLYERGWSVARIGSYLGVNGGTVWLALRAHRVRMRDTHGRER
jgi:DNA-binding transcriptional ArsR family regulator